MNQKRLGIILSTVFVCSLFSPSGAEISTHAGPVAGSPEAAYMQYVGDIQRAQHADQMPAFAHSSPLNKIKLADSPDQEKEFVAGLKEMTPTSLKPEGKVEFGELTYLFYEGDPERSASAKEYFPVTAEMVKEDGKWKLRRQQSWHVKDGSMESQVIPRGQARLKRFQELMNALTATIPATPAKGDVAGKYFKPTIAYFYPRDGYFKLSFVQGEKEFSIYVREGCSLAELQGRHFVITPLDGYEADLMPEQEVFGPYCARIVFGKFNHGLIPGMISMAVRTPEPANLIGAFACAETADTLSPDEEETTKKKSNNK
jgi:hypothetical protein